MWAAAGGVLAAAALLGWRLYRGAVSSKTGMQVRQESAAAAGGGGPDLDTPQLTFILFNSRSGGKQAAEIAAGLARVMGPAMHVRPLDEAGIADTLAALQQLAAEAKASVARPLTNVRLVVCGGDGSIAWIVGRLQSAGLGGIVPIAMVPNGTGNDLSNYMGWGATTMGPLGKKWWNRPDGVLRWMKRLYSSTPVLSDVWEVELDVSEHEGGVALQMQSSTLTEVPASRRKIIMLNYCSVGNDAELLFEVEKRRSGARWINRVLFMICGLRNVFTLQPPVTKVLEGMSVGGNDVRIRSTIGSCGSILVLNEGCYGGGVRLWDIATPLPSGHILNSFPTAPRTPCSNSDGLLDVIAARSMFQLGCCVSSKSSTFGGIHKVAQTDSVRFTFDRPSPKSQAFVQVDGEAYLLLNPTSVTIRRGYRTLLLRSTGEALG